MQALDKLAWEVLNATADDCENIEQIYCQLCYELLPVEPQPGPMNLVFRHTRVDVLLSDIADRIRQLVEGGLLEPVMDEEGRPWQGREDLSYVWRAWLVMTPEGRSTWEASEYLVEQE